MGCQCLASIATSTLGFARRVLASCVVRTCISSCMAGLGALRVGASLEKHLLKKTWSLTESFVKEFQSRSGFVPFENEPKTVAGCALVDPTIQPPIRIVSYDNSVVDEKYIKSSIAEAFSYRQKLSGVGLLDIGDMAAYRLINEAGDGLPGITADIYSKYVILQTYSPAWNPYINTIASTIMEMGDFKGVYWKKKMKESEPSVRHYMGLRFEPDKLLSVVENGMEYLIHLEDPASSGLFMDQRSNRQYIASLLSPPPNEHREQLQKLRDMKFPVIPKKFPTTFEPRYPKTGMMVNAFAHTCSFSIAMAARGSRIGSHNIDISNAYLTRAQKNFHMNDIPMRYHKFITKDVFVEFERMASISPRYDLIVLDPPSIARSTKGGLFTTKRRYHELVELAAPLLKTGGYIVAFINTRSIREEAWFRDLGVLGQQRAVRLGAEEDKRLGFSREKLKDFTILDHLGQDVDFRYKPGDIYVGKYLKGIVMQKGAQKFDFKIPGRELLEVEEEEE